jgi:hypothetical protein
MLQAAMQQLRLSCQWVTSIFIDRRCFHPASPAPVGLAAACLSLSGGRTTTFHVRLH